MSNVCDTYTIQHSDDLVDRIPELAKKCDYLLIDGAAGLSESNRIILLRSDLAVIPCQPTGLDLSSVSDAVKLIRQAQAIRSGNPKAIMFLSRAVKGTKLLSEAKTLLKTSGLTVARTIIHQRQCVADTFGQGKSVWDLTGRPAAESAREFDKLFTELLVELEGNG